MREIDLIYTNTIYSPIGAILAWKIGVPHIWHAHEFSYHLSDKAKFDLGIDISMSLIGKLSEKIICTSDEHKKDFSKYIEPKKIERVYNGIIPGECDQTKINKTNKIINLLIIGSISKNKGQMDAIKALKNIITLGNEAVLTIVGSGEIIFIAALKKLAIELGISDNIKWEGYQKNIYPFISNSDIVLVCSKYETFGRVIVEAMSQYKPVVSTKTGGVLEIIENGFNGLLYDHDDYRTLSQNILLLMKNKDLYDTITKNGYITYNKKFTVSLYVENIVNIINTTLRDSIR